MAKECINPICKKEIPSNAMFCSFCGAKQVDGKLSEEERLQKELIELDKENQLLKIALEDAQIKILENNVFLKKNDALKEELSLSQDRLNIIITRKDQEIENYKIACKKKKRNIGWIVILALFVIGFGILSYYYFEESKSFSELYSSEKSIQNESHSTIYALQGTIDSLQGKLTDIVTQFPIKITRIELANYTRDNNVIDDFGSTLYSGVLQYLIPKIYFENYLSESKDMNFEIHYIDNYGQMKYNHYSGAIPSCKKWISASAKSIELSGWGSPSGETWEAGRWTIEIWCNEVCLGSQEFTIY